MQDQADRMDDPAASGAATFRRGQFLKFGLTGLVAVAIGSEAKLVSGLLGARASAAPAVYDITITDAMVEMINLQLVYHWVFADATGPHLPGPALHALEGDTIELRITNALDEPHAFAIDGTAIATGPIPPGQSRTLSFAAPAPGTYVYLDPLNAPVNRLLGLYGALIVLPTAGNTPYAGPPPRLQRLFDDLGTTAHFPGEPWITERTRVWQVHSVDSRWNAVAAAGRTISAAALVADYRPDFFTLNGQSGYFASHNARNAPSGRVGQPFLIRITNTGLLAHSLHLHGNHFYLCAVGGVPQASVRNIDSWRIGPLERADWMIPLIRPPDIAGPETLPLRQALKQELSYKDSYGLPQCPLEYPMHCHMEPSQTARGGNYPGGLVTHMEITGDLDLSFEAAGFDCEATPAPAAVAAAAGTVHAHG